jgi:hypothetical protein
MGYLDVRALKSYELSTDWFEHATLTLNWLNEFLRVYSARKTTFPEDAYSAFAVVQNMLERFYQSSFIYGIPEFGFDIVLNWIPTKAPLERRTASNLEGLSAVPYRLPSWSWIGWIGSVDFPRDNQLSIDKTYPYTGYTEPVATWYTMATPDSAERRIIRSAWYRHKLLAETHSPLPAGWKCSCDEANSYHYGPIPATDQTHFEIVDPARYHGKFIYTFPVTGPSSADDGTAFPQTSYLFA